MTEDIVRDPQRPIAPITTGIIMVRSFTYKSGGKRANSRQSKAAALYGTAYL